MFVPFRRNKQTTFHEAIRSAAFRIAREQSRLAIPLGSSIDDGNIKILDIAQAGNILIAGSVTSGKTSFVNSMICALVKCYRPDDLKLLLDDVTRVELTSFNGVPHLVRPVITRLEETWEAIEWLDAEIHDRYRKMLSFRAENIEVYNRKNKGIPYIIFIIYELSDLMLGERSAAEPLLCRLAQSGPAVGVHMVIVTQRPEPDVLTSALKLFFPSRICFNVVSVEDSRVVLDIDGAESLPENSEMLFTTIGSDKHERLQGCSITEVELDSIVSQVKIDKARE